MKKNLLWMGMLLLMISITNAQPKEGHCPPKPPTVEEHLKHVSTELDKKLGLSQEEKEKVLSAYKTFFTEMEKNRKEGKELPPPPPPPVSKEIADKLKSERDAKIKIALNEEQYNKYLEVEKQLRPSRPKEHTPPPTN